MYSNTNNQTSVRNRTINTKNQTSIRWNYPNESKRIPKRAVIFSGNRLMLELHSFPLNVTLSMAVVASVWNASSLSCNMFKTSSLGRDIPQ